MGIIFFILIAGLGQRSCCPRSSIIGVRIHGQQPALSRVRKRSSRTSRRPRWGVLRTRQQHAEKRRQRIFIILVFTALTALVIAVVQSSTVWLAITITLDLIVGAYVAMILTAKQPKVVRRAPVVPIQTAVPSAPTTAADLDVEEASPTVRVIAG